MRDIGAKLPFVLQRFKSDSGSEFMNYELMAYFLERTQENVAKMTLSRPYKKDDNCYVEQKNFTDLREIFGHSRTGSNVRVLATHRASGGRAQSAPRY
jgi:hypothetical protein